MKKQARGFGAMLTFQLESREFALGIEDIHDLLEELKTVFLV